MKATFKLDGCNTLEVSNEPLENWPSNGRNFVTVQIKRIPLGGPEGVNANVPAPSDLADESLVFYGPYECRCGKMIVQLSNDRGGYKYERTDLPHYPNTVAEWREHACHPLHQPLAVATYQWKPSEARAVASAILSAATEARG